MFRFHVLVLPTDSNAGKLPSFDCVEKSLEVLTRMFIEPDGSFVWTGEVAGQRWQVDGNLIDRGECLAYVELNGLCPEARFDELLRALDWPDAALAFQLPRRGVTISEAEFRRLAASEKGAA